MNNFIIPQIPSILLFAAFLWTLLWKGIALWRAANLKQKNWFIAILVLNTLGILELVYLFYFAKKRLTIQELKFWEK